MAAGDRIYFGDGHEHNPYKLYADGSRVLVNGEWYSANGIIDGTGSPVPFSEGATAGQWYSLGTEWKIYKNYQKYDNVSLGLEYYVANDTIVAGTAFNVGYLNQTFRRLGTSPVGLEWTVAINKSTQIDSSNEKLNTSNLYSGGQTTLLGLSATAGNLSWDGTLRVAVEFTWRGWDNYIHSTPVVLSGSAVSIWGGYAVMAADGYKESNRPAYISMAAKETGTNSIFFRAYTGSGKTAYLTTGIARLTVIGEWAP